MDLHGNARLCPFQRELMCTRVRVDGWKIVDAAVAAGCSERTAQKWLARFDAGEPMTDRSQPVNAPVPVGQTIAQIVRDEWPQLMATLYRDLGDLDAAQDAAQEAAEVPLTRWLDDGIPDRPGAWITTVARRRAVDRIRRERVGREKTELLARLVHIGLDTQPVVPDTDDQLQLFFGCCHPALSVEAQMALTLRSVGGMTTAEIARGFLVAEATIPFRIPRVVSCSIGCRSCTTSSTSCSTRALTPPPARRSSDST